MAAPALTMPGRPTTMTATFDYSQAPRHEDAVRRYVEEGGHLGDFLSAVFANDFVDAVGRADAANRDLLTDWATFVYNYVPQGCWGSREAVQQWQEQGGLQGKE